MGKKGKMNVNNITGIWIDLNLFFFLSKCAVVAPALTDDFSYAVFIVQRTSPLFPRQELK